MDAVERYLETFERLRRRKRWTTDTNVLRFAALALAAADLNDPARELESAADTLRKKAGWFGSLNSPIRYVAAAMILRNGLRPASVHAAVGRTREAFRERRLRRGGVSETLAALLLVILNDGRMPSMRTLIRVEAILERWKKDHRFLTGVDDYPMAALHAARDEDVESLAVRVESVYRALRRERFSMGNQLQLASHILTLVPGDAATSSRRFADLRRAFKERRQRIWESMYDELALLALTGGSPGAIADAVLGEVERLMSVRPKPQKSVAFSIATGVALSREVERGRQAATTRDAAALASAKALLDAQAAAMAAITVSTTAAVTVTTSH
jgi:hypothetical protein